jgi:hypothetical protein
MTPKSREANTARLVNRLVNTAASTIKVANRAAKPDRKKRPIPRRSSFYRKVPSVFVTL